MLILTYVHCYNDKVSKKCNFATTQTTESVYALLQPNTYSFSTCKLIYQINVYTSYQSYL